MSVVRGVGRGWGCGGVAGSLTWGVCDVVKSVSCEGVCERGSMRCEGVLVGGVKEWGVTPTCCCRLFSN